MNLKQRLQPLSANRAVKTAAVPLPLRAEAGAGSISGVSDGPGQLKHSIVPLQDRWSLSWGNAAVSYDPCQARSQRRTWGLGSP